MNSIRKKPFSTKKKKEQLQLKRKEARERGDKWADSDDESSTGNSCNGHRGRRRVNEQPAQQEATTNPHRYRLNFQRESREEIERRKKLAQLPIVPKDEEHLEMSIEQIYRPGSALDMPIRPPWTYQMTREELEHQETVYFNNYLYTISKNFNSENLSYYEMNLETWRQLWRTIELSDIILMIVDVRYAVLHFAPTLYDHVTQTHKKPLILILNKIDLAPPSIVIAIKDYFAEKFPKLHIVTFTSYPKESTTNRDDLDNYQVMARIARRKNYFAIGPLSLYECISSIVGSRIDLSSWREHIHRCMQDEIVPTHLNEMKVEKVELSPLFEQKKSTNSITLGMTGYPNVGKSTLLNSLVGRKVVSVSRTPGHTKYFQTYHLTETVHLCDCPGLVFPSFVERPLQILAGIYPIAQLREPYTIVGYLAQWLPVAKLLAIEKFLEEIPNPSAMDITEGWAMKRHYFTAKAARPDVSRAANQILRLALEGRINLCLRPPGFMKDKERWIADPRTAELEQLISLAVSKQRGPELTLSGDDESEPFPTSDDHLMGSYSASASDQGPDNVEASNRFYQFRAKDDDENE